MASADLGGLGARDGSPVTYRWVVPNLTPLTVPWLALLVLLGLKPNRRWSAWWIWLPLGCLALLRSVLQPTLNLLPSAVLDGFLEVVTALAFGLAALWLLSHYLAWKHRLLALLGMLAALGRFGLLTAIFRVDWSGGASDVLPIGILLAACVFIIPVAVSLAGWLCRGRYRPLALSLWLMAALVVIWTLVLAPFFAVTFIGARGQIPVIELFAGVLAVAGASFAPLLPFLVLAFASPFFRERIQGLLHLASEPAPQPAVPEAQPSPPTDLSSAEAPRRTEFKL